MDFKPIKPKKISGEIVDQIKRFIIDGQLKPGDKLFSERDLAERLQVSRPSVREALTALEMMGLVEIRPGEGTFLKRITSADMIEPLSLSLLMGKDSYEDILEVRRILEVSCARLAAQRRTEEQLTGMEKALEQMEMDIANNVLGEEADMQFHFHVALATNNSLLIRLMNTIVDSIHENLKKNRIILFSTPGTPQRLLREHRAVYQAIKEKAPKQAGDFMQRHLELVQEEMHVDR